MFPLSRFDKFLVILGIAAVFCLTEAGAGVALTAMLVIIGAPLTILMAAIPGLFLFLLLARLLWFGLKWTGPLSWPLSGVLAVGLLAIVPYMQNRKLDEIALEQLAGDRNKITGPVKLDTLAVVYPKAYYQKGTCGDFCQRALLNGVVRRMIMVRQDMPGRLPGDETIGKSFRIERRQKCPPINLEDGIGNLSIPGEKRDWANKTPLDLLRLKAATGECLIEEEAPLARADAVLVRSPVKSGLRDYYAGLDPFADTVRASRLSFYLRQEGRIVERYRSTGVQAYHLLPVLIPSYVGLGMHYKAGLLRRLVHFGDAARYRSAPELEPFLLNVLGLDLKLDTHKAGQKTRRIITSALDKPGKIDVTATLVIESFFRETSRRKDVSIDDVPLILRVLEDERVPVPYAVG
ncbi:MAG TPA: hypothetical protein ENJ99_01210, partial [Rhizobiales bacterium]|nr:hypothetical protein [Hyphomicrobiales bacterium]